MGKATSAAKTAAPPRPASVDAADDITPLDVGPAHPCPICLVNEDDRGKYVLCYACGQLYCGDCNVAERMGQVENCPTCRAPFAVSALVRVDRLLGLVARSPGRHTPVAQFNLGVMSANGTGVPQNYSEAVRWYRLAADQGHVDGLVNLGVMFDDGTGVPQDYAEAVRWYRLAAAQGDADGQCNLGAMYEQGTGVPQDHTVAAQWFRLAADQGSAGGQFNLGGMFFTGKGVPHDCTEAARLLTLACDQGFQPAEDNLGKLTALCPAGTRVEMTGLPAATYLNGRLGTAVKPLMPLAAGQIAVRIDGQTESMSVSWANIGPHVAGGVRR